MFELSLFSFQLGESCTYGLTQLRTIQPTMKSENLRLFYKLFDGVSKLLTFFGLSFIERCQLSGAYRLSYKRLVYGLLICLFVLFIFYQQITDFFPKENDSLLILLTLYMSVVSTLMAMLMIATAAFNAPALARLLNNPDYFEVFSLESYSFVKFNTIRQFSFCLFVLVACYLSDCFAENEVSLFVAVKIMMFFFFPMYNSFCISELFVYQYWLQRWYWNINDSLRHMASSHDVSVFAVMEMAKCLHIGTGHKTPVFDSVSLLIILKHRGIGNLFFCSFSIELIEAKIKNMLCLKLSFRN